MQWRGVVLLNSLSILVLDSGSQVEVRLLSVATNANVLILVYYFLGVLVPLVHLSHRPHELTFPQNAFGVAKLPVTTRPILNCRLYVPDTPVALVTRSRTSGT